MEENEEKPDLVVWDKEKGYYQKGLSYGSNVSAPAIKLDNVSGWKQANADVANKNFQTKFDELKEEYERLVQEVQLNELVYSSKYNFTPIMGQVYHLYRKADESLFLSMISPDSWKQEYLGSFKLDTSHKWAKIDNN
ncbi:DUF2452 domain-containing protein [Daejeonella sp.]|jgi:hypothetical protein|uniref:DUF2452 domain-containing protein n=1 Tax=Daejeonella sp. TaxID=2805397 RepID=UPI0037BFB627